MPSSPVLLQMLSCYTLFGTSIPTSLNLLLPDSIYYFSSSQTKSLEMQKNKFPDDDDSTADRIYDTIPDNHPPSSSPFSFVGKSTVQPPDIASLYEVPVQGSIYSAIIF